MAVTITQTANPAGVSASSNVATYTGASIGTAAPNRIVVVVVGSELASTPIASCTIDGNAMTAGTGGNQGAVYSQLFYLAYPTGTTANIAVTFTTNSPSSTQNHIAVYSVTGAVYSSKGSDASTDMDSTDPLTTGSTTIAAGGGMLAIAAGATDGTGKSWSNLGEDIDADAGALRFTTAFSTTAGTATRTCTGGTNGEDGALSWIIFTANVSPTTALNSPADTATGVSTTPVLDFTGTDTEGESIRYEVQVDPNNIGSFTTPISIEDNFNDNSLNTPHLFSYTISSGAFAETNNRIELTPAASTVNSEAGIYSDISFDATGKSVHVQLVQAADVTNCFTFLAFNVDSTHWIQMGVRSNPVNNTLYAGYQNGGSVTTVATTTYNSAVHKWIKIRENGGTTYFDYSTDGLVWSNLGSVANPLTMTALPIVLVCNEDTSSATPGVGIFDNLNIYPTQIDKVSGTDAGFANPDNGGDTDPFNSGENIQHTVQSALSNSTSYYWRARGIDPSGSNSYGAWTTTRSFTTGSGSTNITVNAGIPNATFSTQTPTITAIKNITVSPNVQSAVFSTQSSTITAAKNVTVSSNVQSLVASQPSIQITVGDGVSAGVQSATFTAISPTVTAQKNLTTSPSVQSAVFSTQNPTVQISKTVSAGVQTGTFSVLSPTVDTTNGAVNVQVNAGVQSATFTQQLPTITAIKNATISSNVQSGVLSQPTPTVSAIKNSSVSPNVQTATLSQPSPMITLGDGVTPSTLSAVFSQQSPTVTTIKNPTVSLNVQTATFSSSSPTVVGGTDKLVSPNVQSASFSSISPDVITGDTQASVGVNTGLFTALSPTVSTVRNCTVYPQCLTIGQQALIYNERLRPLYRIARDIWLTL